MKLRGKLLLAQVPMIGALALVVCSGLYAALHIGGAPGAILYENFRSFDAARGMLHAADAIDRRVLSAALQDRAVELRDLAEPMAWFEREMRLQQSNITESGEAEATQRLHRAWSAFGHGLAHAGSRRGFSQHQEQSARLRAAVDTVLQMNRDAMRRKSDRARRRAHRVGAALAITAVVAFLIAVVISSLWLRRVLAPLAILDHAVQQVSAGDFDAHIGLGGSDEVASLARSFDEMAEKLAQYRASSLGELLAANNRLSSVMDSLADAVVVYDLQGRPTVRNEVADRLLGAGKLDIERLPESLQDVVRDAFQRVRENGLAYEPASLEAAVELPAIPSPRWLLVSGTPVRADRGAVSGVTIALRDVTRSRRIEGFKSNLVAAAAHELRTPLTSLHMAVHLCLEQTAGPITQPQQDLLLTARQDCERLRSVVEDLLQMARLESGAAPLSRARIDVAALVRTTAARRAADAAHASCELAVRADPELPLIEADSERLRQVLDNLIDNAIKHAGGGGALEISLQAHNGGLRVHVDDAGPGVPAELREHIFVKFFRVPGTEKQGTGLGLSIVQDIIRAHGGEVGVEASSRGGARFWFWLPARSPAIVAQESSPGPSPSS